MKMLNVRIEDKLSERLDEIAEMSGHTRSEVVRYSLEKFAEDNKFIRDDGYRQVFLKHAVAKDG